MTMIGDWASAGEYLDVGGNRIWVRDVPAAGDESRPPLLVLHGFPSCSFDWRQVIAGLGADRRVVLFDFLGYGLSDKPDQPYSLFAQADVATAVAAHAGITEAGLATHDMGNSVGGELLARSIDGTLPFAVTDRLLANGSIYIEMAHLSLGQQMLLAAPDEMLPADAPPVPEMFKQGLGGTFSPGHPASAEELAAQWELLARDDGNRLLPRLIRYIEERRVHEGRWTGAIETHPAPLTVVWGDLDPIAVWPMAERLLQARSDATLVRLDGVGHYPMIETPDRFVAAAGA